MNSYTLPPEFEAAMQQLADTQPELVREMFYWALTMRAVALGQARIVEQRTLDGRDYYTFASPDGVVITLAKPNVNDALLAQMVATVRELADAEARLSAPLDQSDTPSFT